MKSVPVTALQPQELPGEAELLVDLSKHPRQSAVCGPGERRMLGQLVHAAEQASQIAPHPLLGGQLAHETLPGGLRNYRVEPLQFSHTSKLLVAGDEGPVRSIPGEHQGRCQLKSIGGSQGMHGQDALGPGAYGIQAIDLDPVRGQGIKSPYGQHRPGLLHVPGPNPTPYRGQYLHTGQSPDRDDAISA